jgi:hypothetical protein
VTAQIEIPGLVAGDQPRCTDPAELRQRAEQARGRSALMRLEAMTLDRASVQLEHEAALWEVADAADAVMEALHQKTGGLEAAEEGTLAAERTAQDKLREDRRHLARRKGEATRAANASREAQDEAAVRLHKSEQRVGEAETELAAAQQKHRAAEAALEAHRSALRDAGAACKRALDGRLQSGPRA